MSHRRASRLLPRHDPVAELLMLAALAAAACGGQAARQGGPPATPVEVVTLAEPYATLAALVGYRRGRYEVRLSGRNLTDQRDPVAESELGEAQYYRLFPRHFDLLATVRF